MRLPLSLACAASLSSRRGRVSWQGMWLALQLTYCQHCLLACLLTYYRQGMWIALQLHALHTRHGGLELRKWLGEQARLVCRPDNLPSIERAMQAMQKGSAPLTTTPSPATRPPVMPARHQGQTPLPPTSQLAGQHPPPGEQASARKKRKRGRRGQSSAQRASACA